MQDTQNLNAKLQEFIEEWYAGKPEQMASHIQELLDVIPSMMGESDGTYSESFSGISFILKSVRDFLS